MRTLSIRQPWAWLIVNGYKDIENRTWRPADSKGQFLVHASLTFDDKGYKFIKDIRPDIPLPNEDDFEYGGIIGIAELDGCVTSSDSEWFTGPKGLVLKNARPLPFQPRKGKVGFFNTMVSTEYLKGDNNGK